MIVMAKKKPRAGRPKSTKPIRDGSLTIRVTEDQDRWIDDLVEHCRADANWASLPKTAVVIQALICLAKERGFDTEFPK